MRYLALSLVVYATMVAQTSPYTSIIPTSLRMAALTAIAVAVAAVVTNWRGVMIAASIGLLSDLTSPGPPGIEMFLTASLAFCVQWLQTESNDSLLQTAITTFVGVFVVRLVVTTADQFAAGVSGEPIEIAMQTLVAAVGFAIVIPLVCGGWRLMTRIVTGHALPTSTTPTDRWLASSG
jgi:cell shape-determining protein MreD